MGTPDPGPKHGQQLCWYSFIYFLVLSFEFWLSLFGNLSLSFEIFQILYNSPSSPSLPSSDFSISPSIHSPEEAKPPLVSQQSLIYQVEASQIPPPCIKVDMLAFLMHGWQEMPPRF